MQVVQGLIQLIGHKLRKRFFSRESPEAPPAVKLRLLHDDGLANPPGPRHGTERNVQNLTLDGEGVSKV